MKKTVVIAAAVLLALLATAGIIFVTNNKNSSPEVESAPPNVRIMEASTPSDDDDELLRQIEELRAQIEKLEQEKGQAEFDRDASQAEQDKLQKRLADLEEENEYLRDRNSTLSDEGMQFQGVIAARDEELASRREAMVERGEEIARLNDRIAHLEAERNLNYTAYQKAMAQVSEQRESLERRDRALTSAETAGSLHINRKGELVNTFNVLPPGQSRNILGIKFGNRDIDLEGTIALMPHWFLLADIGVSQVPDDFVRDELPGYDADHAFFYEVLAGTGLNWRFNSIQCQPDFYISTMAGPAWFYYKMDGDIDMKTYLLWRSSVGFDVTLHKHLQFTGDISFDWVPDYRFTPRFTLGVLWSFSNEWAIIRKK